MPKIEDPKTVAFHSLVGLLCQYEVAALLSRRRLPTLTRLSARHKWLAPVILAGLGVHLYRKSWRAIEIIEAVEKVIEEESAK